MSIFVVLMLSSDCSQYVYGAYARQNEACEAEERCERFEKVWQYEAWTESQEEHTVLIRKHFAGRPVWSVTTTPPNLCLTQKVQVGQDDKVEDVWCPKANIHDLQ